MAKEYIAKESTSQTILTNVQEAISDVGAVQSSLGQPGDTGGSTTAGSVTAKLNQLLAEAAREGTLDELSSAMSGVVANLGQTGDTGGSATAGSVMGKINALLNRLTTSRASKLDNIGSTGDVSASTTTGTVMGKLNQILSSMGSMGSPVKRVLRGSVYFTEDDDGKVISIDNVNVNKSVVLLSASGSLSNRDEMWERSVGAGYELTSTTLTIHNDVSSSNRDESGSYTVYWQIVEFN